MSDYAKEARAAYFASIGGSQGAWSGLPRTIRTAWTAAVAPLVARLEKAEGERDALRARVAELEKQREEATNG